MTSEFGDFKSIQQSMAKQFQQDLKSLYPDTNWIYMLDEIAINCSSKDECMQMYKLAYSDLIDNAIEELMVNEPYFENWFKSGQSLSDPDFEGQYMLDMNLWEILFQLHFANKCSLKRLREPAQALMLFKIFIIHPSGAKNIYYLIRLIRALLRFDLEVGYSFLACLDPEIWKGWKRTLNRQCAIAIFNSLLVETYPDAKYSNLPVINRAIEYIGEQSLA